MHVVLVRVKHWCFWKYGMVWYGMVTLFIHNVPLGTFTFKYRKTNFLTNLKSKIKAKIIKMKRKLFKEAVCKNRISLIKLLSQSKFMSLNFPLNILGDVNCRTSRGKLFHNTLSL